MHTFKTQCLRKFPQQIITKEENVPPLRLLYVREKLMTSTFSFQTITELKERGKCARNADDILRTEFFSIFKTE